MQKLFSLILRFPDCKCSVLCKLVKFKEKLSKEFLESNLHSEIELQHYYLVISELRPCKGIEILLDISTRLHPLVILNETDFISKLDSFSVSLINKLYKFHKTDKLVVESIISRVLSVEGLFKDEMWATVLRKSIDLDLNFMLCYKYLALENNRASDHCNSSQPNDITKERLYKLMSTNSLIEAYKKNKGMHQIYSEIIQRERYPAGLVSDVSSSTTLQIKPKNVCFYALISLPDPKRQLPPC